MIIIILYVLVVENIFSPFYFSSFSSSLPLSFAFLFRIILTCHCSRFVTYYIYPRVLLYPEIYNWEYFNFGNYHDLPMALKCLIICEYDISLYIFCACYKNIRFDQSFVTRNWNNRYKLYTYSEYNDMRGTHWIYHLEMYPCWDLFRTNSRLGCSNQSHYIFSTFRKTNVHLYLILLTQVIFHRNVFMWVEKKNPAPIEINTPKKRGKM